ncbi:MAG: hypothetical protein ABL986_01745 [Vicinamibacterales bacterium]
MRTLLTLVAVTTLNMIAFAQSPAPAPAQVPTGSTPNAFESVTVVGCIQRESDFRRGQAPGRAGSGGVEAKPTDQFVLTDTAVVGAPSPTPGPPLPVPVPAVEVAYQLTGPNESQAQEFLGRRVEIAGRANPVRSTHAPSAPGPVPVAQVNAAPAPPAATVSLAELEVMSIKASAGTCSAR